MLEINPPKIDYALLLRRMVALGLKDSGQYMWSHVPLESDTDQIRLLALLPGKVGEEEIRCKEVRVNLKDNVAYEALSYTWGNPHTTHCITFESKPFPVTENLYFALEQLRPTEVPRYLWIDALCIDQLNDVEKSAQVQLMGDIYKRASRVLIWLGKAEDDSDLAMDFFNGQPFIPIKTEYQLDSEPQVQSNRGKTKQIGEPADVSIGGLEIFPSVNQGEDEELLREQKSIPQWLTGLSIIQQRAQHIFLDADTVLLPIEGRCNRCERYGVSCWWNGQDPCVRYLMVIDNTANPCSFLDSQLAPRDSSDPENVQKSLTDLPTLYKSFTSSNTRSNIDVAEDTETMQQTSKLWTALHKMTERPWWRRVWVLQEMAMTEHDPVIMCGNKTTSWHAIQDFARNALDLSKPTDPMIVHFNMYTQIYYPIRQNARKNSSLSLSYLLKTTLGLESSDPRDKVFALLGLAHPTYRQGRKPDYSLSVETVYTQTALHIICTTGKLDTLSFNTASTEPFPSWVSNWSLGTSRHWPIFVTGLYDASGGRMAEIFRSPSPNTLTIRGFAISRVSHISEPIKPNGI